MDLKWLIIVFIGVLGVFRGAYPLGFKHWSTLQFKEFEGSGGIGKLLFSLILCASFSLIVSFAVDIDLNPWLCMGAVLSLLFFRITGTLLLSALFSLRMGVPKFHSTQGFLVASFTYASIALGILVNLLVFHGSSQVNFYIIVAGHVLGLFCHVVTSPTLQNIDNMGSRFYSILYLCTLELVLIFSFVN